MTQTSHFHVRIRKSKSGHLSLIAQIMNFTFVKKEALSGINTELEHKYEFDAHQFHFLKDYLLKDESHAVADDLILSFHVRKHREYIYFDTQELDLKHKNFQLSIRKRERDCFITFKSPKNGVNFRDGRVEVNDSIPYDIGLKVFESKSLSEIESAASLEEVKRLIGVPVTNLNNPVPFQVISNRFCVLDGRQNLTCELSMDEIILKDAENIFEMEIECKNKSQDEFKKILPIILVFVQKAFSLKDGNEALAWSGKEIFVSKYQRVLQMIQKSRSTDQK